MCRVNWKNNFYHLLIQIRGIKPTEGQEISELPYESKVSQDSNFLAVGLYNGDVEVY